MAAVDVNLREVTAAIHGAINPGALRAEGVQLECLVDFSSNQSPLGAPPEVRAVMASVAPDVYPDPRAAAFCAVAAGRHGLAADYVVAGNGSTELIRLIGQLALRAGAVAVSFGPSFGEYDMATRLCDARLVDVLPIDLGSGRGFACSKEAMSAALANWEPSLCWLCSPHNPTGAIVPPSLLVTLLTLHPHTLFVLDEAYCDLLPEPQWSQPLLDLGNLIVLRSMTKAWGLAGLRLGYAVSTPRIAASLRAAIPPWSVNACAQAAGVVALANQAHHDRSVALLRGERDRMMTLLCAAGWVVEPSAAGFFLVRVGEAAAFRRRMLDHACLVRDCGSFGLEEHVRISPRQPAENDRLLAAFAQVASA